LELVFYYGFSPDEVANILAIAPGTVKSRISYARRALLQLLNETSVREMQP
jgi:DNA-directed RNA polymerase specialized sigma24 family protein